MINYQITVSGRVQGVGFRWSTQQLATELGLVGFVQNLMNGDVLIEVQGPKDIVQQFVRKVRAGVTPYARVTNVQIKPGQITDFKDFSIKASW